MAAMGGRLRRGRSSSGQEGEVPQWGGTGCDRRVPIGGGGEAQGTAVAWEAEELSAGKETRGGRRGVDFFFFFFRERTSTCSV